MRKRTLYSAEHLSFSFKRAIFPPCYNFRILEITACGIRDPWLWIPECKFHWQRIWKSSTWSRESTTWNPFSSSIFTTDYVFIFRNETCWSRLVRNSNKVKWKRLMFQKQYPVDLVIKYIWAIILLRKKQSIEETLTVGFNHAVADTGERAPLIFTPKGGPKGRKKCFRRPPPFPNDSLVEAVMLNCL